MKMKVSDLTGPELDYWVAEADGLTPYREDASNRYWLVDTPEMPAMIVGQKPKPPKPELRYSPSVNWSQGGPIIELEGISVEYVWHVDGRTPTRLWAAEKNGVDAMSGITPLIAAMRCFVASRLGGEVDDSQTHHI